jgi:ELWxxDGT repeat protein
VTDAGAGARLVEDIDPGGAGSDPKDLTVVGQTLYFTAADGSSGRELWRTDPALGAIRVKDIYPGPAGSNPDELTAVGDTLYFAANDGSSGRELWRTDPALGAVRVKDIRPGAKGSDPDELTVVLPSSPAGAPPAAGSPPTHPASVPIDSHPKGPAPVSILALLSSSQPRPVSMDGTPVFTAVDWTNGHERDDRPGSVVSHSAPTLLAETVAGPWDAPIVAKASSQHSADYGWVDVNLQEDWLAVC